MPSCLFRSQYPIQHSNMSSATPIRRPTTDVAELKTTSYEKASLGLTAVLLLFGGITFLMFLIWLSAQFTWERPVAVVGMNQDVGGRKVKQTHHLADSSSAP